MAEEMEEIKKTLKEIERRLSAIEESLRVAPPAVPVAGLQVIRTIEEERGVRLVEAIDEVGWRVYAVIDREGESHRYAKLNSAKRAFRYYVAV